MVRRIRFVLVLAASVAGGVGCARSAALESDPAGPNQTVFSVDKPPVCPYQAIRDVGKSSGATYPREMIRNLNGDAIIAHATDTEVRQQGIQSGTIIRFLNADCRR